MPRGAAALVRLRSHDVLTHASQDFEDPYNPAMRLACTHKFHLPCLLALEQRSRFCPCCNAVMVHPALGQD